ncbi:hypothetical protein BGAL_0057g00030 [Botrytis galanthina]|uniref:Uncharacterized protein n=1 Tax=Botrytis galanthina TaxID=278940 RepID=A0A4S8R5F3_9HELO|nr:hypothetical protein BGAL_0057g00030 [Botrytis galanthina]
MDGIGHMNIVPNEAPAYGLALERVAFQGPILGHLPAFAAAEILVHAESSGVAQVGGMRYFTVRPTMTKLTWFGEIDE